jgi:hypothetical protein
MALIYMTHQNCKNSLDSINARYIIPQSNNGSTERDGLAGLLVKEHVMNLGESGIPAEIEARLTEINEALGDTVAIHESPCGTVAYYDEGETLPWRIADDHASESFATAEEAVIAAAAWVDAYVEMEEQNNRDEQEQQQHDDDFANMMEDEA